MVCSYDSLQICGEDSELENELWYLKATGITSENQFYSPFETIFGCADTNELKWQVLIKVAENWATK